MLLKGPFQAHDAQLNPRPEVEYCLQCAVCGLVCVVNYADVYEPRHTFVYDLFNDGIEARETLWGCPSCHKCEERCPYDFRPLDLVKGHKEAAFAAGLAPKEIYAEFDMILTTGSAFPAAASPSASGPSSACRPAGPACRRAGLDCRAHRPCRPAGGCGP